MRRGFTLIELLVVISIIAIIAAILFPSFMQARERGRQIACVSNLKQISMGAMLYSQDNDGDLVPNWWGADDPAQGYAGSVRWMDLVLPYLKTKDVYSCPDNAGPAYKPSPIDESDQDETSLFNPGSYAINEAYWWGGSLDTTQRDSSDGVLPPSYTPPNSTGQTVPINDSMLEHPSTTVYITDYLANSQAVTAIGLPTYSLAEVGWTTQIQARQYFDQMFDYSPPIMDTVQFRHQEGVNVVYCDGHVKHMQPRSLFEVGSYTPTYGANAGRLEIVYKQWIIEESQ